MCDVGARLGGGVNDECGIFVYEERVDDACDVASAEEGDADDLCVLPVFSASAVLWCVGECVAAVVFDHAAAEDGERDAGDLCAGVDGAPGGLVHLELPGAEGEEIDPIGVVLFFDEDVERFDDGVGGGLCA